MRVCVLVLRVQSYSEGWFYLSGVVETEFKISAGCKLGKLGAVKAHA